MRKQKPCKSCGLLFLPAWSTSSVCPSCKRRTCRVCGKAFDIHSLTRAKVYCSRDCYAEGKRQLGQKPPTRPTKSRSPVACPHCGQITQRLPSEIKFGAGFCNRACYLAYRRAQRTSRDSDEYFYFSADWIKLRRRAKWRDKHTCQICQVVFSRFSRSLIVHHVIPRRMFADISDSLHEKADLLGNLMALCNSCHQKVHMGSAHVPVNTIEEG